MKVDEIKTGMIVEELRQAGLQKIRENQTEDSLPLFDEALGLASDAETRQLLVLNKAGALIALGRLGAEVQALPQIIMRRQNERHVFIAAYHLQYKYRLESDYKKAVQYGRIALETADLARHPEWKPDVLIELGNISVFDSRTTEAIAFYEEALTLLDGSAPTISRAFAMQNLGYCRLLTDEYDLGIALIHEAIGLIGEAGAQGYLAESYIDLCFGYLETADLLTAQRYGELGLSMATEARQIRNAHYLLGEAGYKLGDLAKAEKHFGYLAQFYPDFPHLKDFLLAIDLRGMVNLKLS